MEKAKHAKKLVALVLIAGTPAVAQCELSTSLAGFKNTPDGGTAFFDVAVASWPIEIHALELNVSTDPGTPFHVEIFTAPDTFRGKELDPTQWALRASGNGQSAGMGSASWLPLNATITLDADSSQGMAIVITGGGHRYENGNGTNEFFENDDLSIRMGAATFGAFGPSAFLPRVWNGTIEYRSPKCSCPCSCNFHLSALTVCDIFDFLAFQNAFVNGEPCACDFDITTGVGVCDIFDFLAFQNGFIAGCP